MTIEGGPSFEKEPKPEIKDILKDSRSVQPVHNDKQILSEGPLHSCMTVWKCHTNPSGKVCRIAIKIFSSCANKTKENRRYYFAGTTRKDRFKLFLDVYAIEPKKDGTYAQNSWLEFY